MPIQDLDIFCSYDKQRFAQFSPMDAANWYKTSAPSGKKKQALYPVMGRKHIRINDQNVLQFDVQPREIFRSINFMYVVVANQVWQVDSGFAMQQLVNSDFQKENGEVFFSYLPTTQTPTSPAPSFQRTFCMLTDGNNIYVIDEQARTMVTVTDLNAPPNPRFVAAFGNRFVVSSLNSTQFSLTSINLVWPVNEGGAGVFNPAHVFTVAGQAVFAQEEGLIQQFAVLHNQLYIFNDYTTGIWSNNPSTLTLAGTVSQFPWKKNTSYNWDYGMSDPLSLDVDFGRMTWLAQNRNGLIEFMTSDGQMPVPISTQAINVILQQAANNDQKTGFIIDTAVGFLYQYEDTVFYRVSAGTKIIDSNALIQQSTDCMEYNFETQSWHRCIELNGSRNLIQDHVFFSSKHIVTVLGESTLYEMAGDFYTNEFRNIAAGAQDPLAYIAYPFRYELTTAIIAQNDYSEFLTEWMQVDFVWGDQSFVRFDGAFSNTVFIVDEQLDQNAEPIYMVDEDGETFIIKEGTNIPSLSDTFYNALYKPSISLYISDDGGISFYSADNLQFSQLGVYSWRMRWYQCGVSRNRCYKLVCVSPGPIVVLGATHNVRLVSGGAA